ncbi:hypothetical protein F4861DRAFT_541209 [Xylaria intraflava]|nr:hypothetical protein F4861DRAFT_541209 [Xylaria intraflava]
MATTSSTSARRTSASTDVTVTENTRQSTDKAAEFQSKKEQFDDDEKTLANFAEGEGSSDDLKDSDTTTRPESKSETKKGKGKAKAKKPLPPDYYPSNLLTYMAMSRKSRMKQPVDLFAID